MYATIINFENDNKQRISELYAQGKNASEIQDETGLSKSYVYDVLREIKAENSGKKSGRKKAENSGAENELIPVVKTLEKEAENLRNQLSEKEAELKKVRLESAEKIVLLENENSGLQYKLSVEEAENKRIEEKKNELFGKIEQLESEKAVIEKQRDNAIRMSKEKDDQIAGMKKPGIRLMRFLHSDALVNIVMILLSLGIAHGVTAPILVLSGVENYVAQPLAICADIAAYILLSRGVKGGWFFAILAGVQVLIITGGLEWINVLTVKDIAASKGFVITLHYDIPAYIKSFALACITTGAIGKFGELIHEAKTQ